MPRTKTQHRKRKTGPHTRKRGGRFLGMFAKQPKRNPSRSTPQYTPQYTPPQDTPPQDISSQDISSQGTPQYRTSEFVPIQSQSQVPVMVNGRNQYGEYAIGGRRKRRTRKNGGKMNDLIPYGVPGSPARGMLTGRTQKTTAPSTSEHTVDNLFSNMGNLGSLWGSTTKKDNSEPFKVTEPDWKPSTSGTAGDFMTDNKGNRLSNAANQVKTMNSTFPAPPAQGSDTWSSNRGNRLSNAANQVKTMTNAFPATPAQGSDTWSSNLGNRLSNAANQVKTMTNAFSSKPTTGSDVTIPIGNTQRMKNLYENNAQMTVVPPTVRMPNVSEGPPREMAENASSDPSTYYVRIRGRTPEAVIKLDSNRRTVQKFVAPDFQPVFMNYDKEVVSLENGTVGAR